MTERVEERRNAAGPEACEPTSVDALTPFRDDAAFQWENLRAGIAQVSALVPFVGPAMAFAANPRGSFARREAAKAFNGQAAALLAGGVLSGPLVILFFAIHPWFNFTSFIGLPLGLGGVLALWLIHAIIGTASALRGRDWTAPLARVVQIRMLPEGSPDPTRLGRQARDER